MEAYEIALRGDYFLAQHDATSADSARRTYERAAAADRKSAVPAARAARARAELLQRLPNPEPRTVGEQVLAGMAMIDAALARDSGSAEAWTARALLLRYRNPETYAGVLAAHERAVARDPTSADAHEQYGITLMQLGKDAAAEQHLRRALALDANRARTLRALGDLEYLRRRYGPSCALANASIGADPYDPLAYSLRARVRMQLSEFRDALSDAEIALRLSAAPWSNALQLLVTASGTTVDDARLEIKRVVGAKLRPGTKMTPAEGAFTSLALEALGDRDRALEALRRIDPTGVEFAMALRDPRFDQMRGDARFRRISAASSRASQAESTNGSAVKRLVGSVPP
jgi:tetratricopeptide (TPR) repeat protein